MDVNSSFELTNSEWDRLKPLLSSDGSQPDARDVRRMLDGILWVMHSGGSWQSLPARYGEWRAVNEAFQQWALSGWMDRLLDALEASAHDDAADLIAASRNAPLHRTSHAA